MNFKKIILILTLFYTPFIFAEELEETPRAVPIHMAQEDIIQLSQAGVSDEVIINQIKATRSAFFLNNEEIITLKQAGVSDDIINFMIETGIEIPRAILVEPPPIRIRYYSYYDPWYDYWWGNSWYDDWWWRHRRRRRRHGVGIFYHEIH